MMNRPSRPMDPAMFKRRSPSRATTAPVGSRSSSVGEKRARKPAGQRTAVLTDGWSRPSSHTGSDATGDPWRIESLNPTPAQTARTPPGPGEELGNVGRSTKPNGSRVGAGDPEAVTVADAGGEAVMAQSPALGGALASRLTRSQPASASVMTRAAANPMACSAGTLERF